MTGQELTGIRRIELSKHVHGWDAKFIGAPEIVALMGTDIIPTAFTERAGACYVQAEIARLNPGFLVSVVG